MDYSILVNKDNPLPRAYIPNTLENVHSEYKENILLDNKALEAFQELKREALRYGYHIDIVSGYRDYDYQEKIYNKLLEEKGFTYAITRIASPGKSEHQTGLAMDVGKIDDDYGETKEGIWLKENAHKYGFIQRYPKGKENITGYKYEAWHYRYVGKKIAKYIYENDISFEEYYAEFLDN